MVFWFLHFCMCRPVSASLHPCMCSTVSASLRVVRACVMVAACIGAKGHEDTTRDAGEAQGDFRITLSVNQRRHMQYRRPSYVHPVNLRCDGLSHLHTRDSQNQAQHARWGGEADLHQDVPLLNGAICSGWARGDKSFDHQRSILGIIDGERDAHPALRPAEISVGCAKRILLARWA